MMLLHNYQVVLFQVLSNRCYQTTNCSINQYTDSLVKTNVSTEQVLSGSLVPQLLTGVVSGSSQVDTPS